MVGGQGTRSYPELQYQLAERAKPNQKPDQDWHTDITGVRSIRGRQMLRF